MRLTKENVDELNSILIDILDDSGNQVHEAAETWLDDEQDADDRRDAREQLEEYLPPASRADRRSSTGAGMKLTGEQVDEIANQVVEESRPGMRAAIGDSTPRQYDQADMLATTIAMATRRALTKLGYYKGD